MKKLLPRMTSYLLLGCLIPMLAGAASRNATGIGQVASNMLEPVGLMSDFVQSACFIIGGGFLFASIIKYMEHRRSPLMVPISTVVFLVIAGVVLILIPFLSLLSGNGVIYSLMKH